MTIELHDRLNGSDQTRLNYLVAAMSVDPELSGRFIDDAITIPPSERLMACFRALREQVFLQSSTGTPSLQQLTLVVHELLSRQSMPTLVAGSALSHALKMLPAWVWKEAQVL